ncbi:MAG: GNAT family N-acetyltransferase [Clostridiales bacterium]|nr:GNAT family N-acetyltransferase [Clostridiales bacterium]
MYQGKKVLLRALDNSDLMASLDHMNDYETMRGVTSGLILPSNVDDEARFFSAQSRSNRGEYQFAIETLEGRRYIGRCGLIHVDWKNRLAELAILIGEKNARGQGFGTDAVDVLCRFAFEEMGLHKLSVRVFAFNTAALRCYEKCGFEREGVLKKEYFREGKFHDVICMGRINE